MKIASCPSCAATLFKIGKKDDNKQEIVIICVSCSYKFILELRATSNEVESNPPKSSANQRIVSEKSPTGGLITNHDDIVKFIKERGRQQNK